MFFFRIDARSDLDSQGRFSRGEVILVGINLAMVMLMMLGRDGQTKPALFHSQAKQPKVYHTLAADCLSGAGPLIPGVFVC